MKKYCFLFIIFTFLFFINTTITAQSVGINEDGSTPNTSAILDIKSTDKGLLIPRTDTATVNAAGTPANGLMIYSPTDTRFYYYNGTKWIGQGGSLMDNDQDTGIEVEQSPDEDTLRFKVGGYEVAILDSTSLQIYGKSAGTYVGYYTGRNENGDLNWNTGFGFNVLRDNTSGQFNVGVGPEALKKNIDGDWNTGSGLWALKNNTSGDGNTAYGYRSLDSNTIGGFNVAVGYKALAENETASQNVAMGNLALRQNTVGEGNVAVGAQALRNNVSGDNNTAVGFEALENNTAYGNTATGYQALMDNTDGNLNTAMGHRSLAENISGQFNSAFGYNSLDSNTIGLANTAVGCFSLRANSQGNRNVAMGYDALVSNKTGSFNTASGYAALASNINGDNNTAIGTSSLFSNTNGYGNTAVGYLSLENNTEGYRNTAVGLDAARFNTTGYRNVALGWGALQKNNTGAQNTAAGYTALFRSKGENTISIGSFSGVFDTLSLRNVFLGNNAGAGGAVNTDLHTKSENVMVGFNSGRLSQGSNNIFLGAYSGENEMGNNKLYIENSNGDSNQALIYGEFDNDLIRLNGKVIMRDGWADTDCDTKIEIEQNADEDKIRLTIDNTEALRLEKNGNGDIRYHTAGNDFNTFMGFNSGVINTGDNNTAYGHQALGSNTSGGANTALGTYSMNANSNGSNNTTVGWGSLSQNISGSGNVAMGLNALSGNTIGSNNTAIGASALRGNKSGNSTVAYGYRAGTFDTTSVNNVYIGANAGAGGTTIVDNHNKNSNVMIGYNSGQFAQGDGNVFLGFESGENETGNNKLYIENSNADANNALIYGEFNNDLLRINGELNIQGQYSFPEIDGSANQILKKNGFGDLIWSNDNNGYWTQSGSDLSYNSGGVAIGGSPEHLFHVIGSDDGEFMSKIENQNEGTKSSGLIIEVGDDTPGSSNIFVQFYGQKPGGGQTDVGTITGDGSGGVTYNTTSDRRLKQNIIPFTTGLEMIDKINAHSYEMKANPGVEHIGFIAQELYEVLPNIVKGTPETTDEENPMMVDYSKITPVLLAAIKELKNENETLKREVAALKKRDEKIAQIELQLAALQKILPQSKEALNKSSAE